ncbi:calcium-activated chloride channel regulator family member 3-like [Macrobrachium rosenbergii]|uniref:calcium-activated chloride channel regulator family member 3-like n=1 Tax=Macrobrachium rosenbergii TaxID=79674 RepID=UPI0034D62764
MQGGLLLVTTTVLYWRVASGMVVLEDNRYKGLVVALDPNQSPPSYEQQEKIINNIQEMMKKASEAVFEATNHRAFFSEITVVLPKTWSVTPTRNASGRWESWKGSDLRIVQNGRYNDAPLTVPGGGCGVPGSRLEVPMTYLTDLTVQLRYGDTGKVVAAEWIKYRYGVYEEHGYPGDKVFPHAYSDPAKNETLPTGCTDQDALVGLWRKENGGACDVMSTGELDAKCRYEVEGTSANYSIMYISHVEKVRHLCDKETHDPLPPTPQNKHCRGQGIWEVMLKHDDFLNGKNPPISRATDTIPTFTLVKMTTPALYLLVDDNCGRKSSEGSQCYGMEVYTKLKDTLRGVLGQWYPAGRAEKILEVCLGFIQKNGAYSDRGAGQRRFP